VPSAFVLGLLAGIAEFVPYFGPVIAAVPGLLVALGVGPDVLLWALVVYVIVQQLESNVITPLVQRQVVWLPPALTLFAAVGMAMLFGLPGLLLATPLTVLLFVLVKKLYVADTLHEPADLPGDSDESPAGAHGAHGAAAPDGAPAGRRTQSEGPSS
jgi:predicted PurR-regulated permease PerM